MNGYETIKAVQEELSKAVKAEKDGNNDLACSYLKYAILLLLHFTLEALTSNLNFKEEKS